MITSFATAAVGVVLLALGWVWIQRAWTRVFPEACSDPDPLAGRFGCHGCGSEETCGRGPAQRARLARREIP